MKQYRVLPYSRIFDLFTILNRENIPDCRAVAIREIDASGLDRLRETLRRDDLRPSYTSCVAKATALVLQEMPATNRAVFQAPFFRRVVEFLRPHVSVAVERTDCEGQIGGAFIYTVYDTDQKSLQDISREIAGLSQATLESGDPRLERWKRMREGVRAAPFLWVIRLVIWIHKNIPSLYLKNRGGAALISSPSKYGVDFIVAHWPYTLGISFGLIKERPWVEQGRLVVRRTLTLTLAFDRRLVPGAEAAKFMNRLCEILEEPAQLA